MFKTLSALSEESLGHRLHAPETAQGMFVNFKNVLTNDAAEAAVRIARGRQSFRTITSGQLYLPHREFESDGARVLRGPVTADEWYAHWSQARYHCIVRYGLGPRAFRMRPHEADELASLRPLRCVDVEYHYPCAGG